MESVSVKLLVYFEDPFWVGVVERVSENKLSVAKLTFGAEPKDYEVLELLLKDWKRLRFSPAVAAERKEPPKNPQAPTARGLQAAWRHRHRHALTAGAANAARAAKDRAQGAQPRAARRRKAASIRAAAAKEKREAQGAVKPACASK